MGDTIQRPGGDAAVVRVHGTSKGLALTCDVTPRYVLADPVMGAKQAVAESWRNLIAVGADPLAITDNMNFGNPERPEIMGQFVGAIDGMKEACEVLKYPVVSGNVSLYNETNGQAIPPTPAIGGVGLVPDLAHTASIALKAEGNLLVAIGREAGHLGQSLYQLIVTGKLEGAPPPVDLADEIKAGNLVRSLIREGKVRAVHDVSDGGLLVAIAEMALAGEIGVQLFPYEGKLPRARRLVRRGPGPLRPGGRARHGRGDHRAGAAAGVAGPRGRPRRRRCAHAQVRARAGAGRPAQGARGLAAEVYGSIATLEVDVPYLFLRHAELAVILRAYGYVAGYAMAEEPTNLVLEHLRHIRSQSRRPAGGACGTLIVRVAVHRATRRRACTSPMSSRTSEIDRIKERLERIERRLGANRSLSGPWRRGASLRV